MRELAELVGELAGRPLSRLQPLWEMWVVEGLADGRMALVMKLHHSMLDGATGASLMGSLMDLSQDAAPPKAPAEAWNPPPLPSALEVAWHSIGSDLPSPLFLGKLALKTWRAVESRRRAQLETTPDGASPPPLVDMGAPITQINGTITGRRTVAYGSVPLEDLKTIKNAYGVTVNDAILAATTLMLRRYLEERDDLPDKPLTCVVPVSTKTIEEKEELSNKVSSFVIDLPTHLDKPQDIIEAVKRESTNTKHIFEAVEEDVLPDWLRLIPGAAIGAMMRLNGDLRLSERLGWTMANVVVSNMMGPPVPLYFGGARVEAVYPMGPVAHGIGLNLTLMSNMGRIDLGVMACPERVPDPWAVTQGFTQAVAELRLAAEKLEASRTDQR
jgi:WS/DGAT/MGAT family acyltransferase